MPHLLDTGLILCGNEGFVGVGGVRHIFLFRQICRTTRTYYTSEQHMMWKTYIASVDSKAVESFLCMLFRLSPETANDVWDAFHSSESFYKPFTGMNRLHMRAAYGDPVLMHVVLAAAEFLPFYDLTFMLTKVKDAKQHDTITCWDVMLRRSGTPACWKPHWDIALVLVSMHIESEDTMRAVMERALPYTNAKNILQTYVWKIGVMGRAVIGPHISRNMSALVDMLGMHTAWWDEDFKKAVMCAACGHRDAVTLRVLIKASGFYENTEIEGLMRADFAGSDGLDVFLAALE